MSDGSAKNQALAVFFLALFSLALLPSAEAQSDPFSCLFFSPLEFLFGLIFKGSLSCPSDALITIGGTQQASSPPSPVPTPGPTPAGGQPLPGTCFEWENGDPNAPSCASNPLGWRACCQQTCVDLESDQLNCGSCGNACVTQGPSICSGGSCVLTCGSGTVPGFGGCPDGMTCCGTSETVGSLVPGPFGGCRLLAADPQNCGACGYDCTSFGINYKCMPCSPGAPGCNCSPYLPSSVNCWSCQEALNCNFNFSCDPGESFEGGCVSDCPPPGFLCPNLVCEPGENCFNCPSDCANDCACNQNGSCELGETNLTCPGDCPGAQCGDFTCDVVGGENCANCPTDCGGCTCNSNGACDQLTENFVTCPDECEVPSTCNDFNPLACGAGCQDCIQTHGVGAVCNGGMCGCPPQTQSCVDELGIKRCTNAATDPSNCGGCASPGSNPQGENCLRKTTNLLGQQVPAPEVCYLGTCGVTACTTNNNCQALGNDYKCCGAAGSVKACTNVNSSASVANCGACGNTCGSGGNAGRPFCCPSGGTYACSSAPCPPPI